MNKIIHETDLVEKALVATHKIRQPSWAAHCQALSINMDEAEKEAETHRTRPTIKVRTPAYDFHPTPLMVIRVQEPELELDWEIASEDQRSR